MTRDGNLEEFHRKCDGMSPTLVIYKTDADAKNAVFGGYTDISWASTGEGKKGDGNTFIFSVRDNNTIEKFKSIKGQEEVYHDKSQLTFGYETIEVTDIQIQDKFCKTNLSYGDFEKPKVLQPLDYFVRKK